ncbi:MAG: hypothetical protein ACLQGV_12755 [Bryobacteraceae bacterium]
MTPSELKALGLLFQDLADWLADYPTKHKLDDPTLRGFEVAFGNVQKIASSLMNQAVEIAITDVGATVQKLQDATQQAAAAVKTVENLTKGFAIAGALADLGAAVLHPTPGSVLGALDTLGQAIRKAAAPPAAAPGSK